MILLVFRKFRQMRNRRTTFSKIKKRVIALQEEEEEEEEDRYT